MWYKLCTSTSCEVQAIKTGDEKLEKVSARRRWRSGGPNITKRSRGDVRVFWRARVERLAGSFLFTGEVPMRFALLSRARLCWTRGV